MRRLLLFCIAFLLGFHAQAQAIRSRDGITLPPPPAVDANPVTDDYFGTKIVDSYRWLEDAKSTETRAFIDAQNAYTSRYLKQAHIHSQVLDDLDALEHVSRWSIPIQRAGNLYFMKRLAGEEQASIYVRRAMAQRPAKGAQAVPKDERLVDPAVFSRDPNTSVRLVDVSRDGTLLAYQVRQGGADESTVRFFSIKIKQDLLKTNSPPASTTQSIFTPDGKASTTPALISRAHCLYLHVLGTRNARDTLIFGREFHGELLGPIDLFHAEITDDARYLVVTIDRGVPATRVDIVFRDLTKPNSPFDILVWGLDSRFSAIMVQRRLVHQDRLQIADGANP